MIGGTLLAALREAKRRIADLLDSRRDRKDGLAGTCGLCGKSRRDLGEDGLCRPCSMAVW